MKANIIIVFPFAPNSVIVSPRLSKKGKKYREIDYIGQKKERFFKLAVTPLGVEFETLTQY